MTKIQINKVLGRLVDLFCLLCIHIIKTLFIWSVLPFGPKLLELLYFALKYRNWFKQTTDISALPSFWIVKCCVEECVQYLKEFPSKRRHRFVAHNTEIDRRSQSEHWLYFRPSYRMRPTNSREGYRLERSS